MQAIIDPSEARQFATQLRDAAAELRRLNRAATVRLTEMHANSWSDARYREFERRFDEVSELVASFTERAEKYADYLDRKARPIEEYLRRHYPR